MVELVVCTLQLQSLCPGFSSHHRRFKYIHVLMPFQDSVSDPTTAISVLISKTDHVHSSFFFSYLFIFFVHVCLQVALVPARFGRQVGNASVYLCLLLRPPWPVSPEKEEKKEEKRGAAAAAGLRNCGLTILGLKNNTRVYVKKKKLC